MTFRVRLLLGILGVTLVPLAGVAVLVRGEMRAVVTTLEADRVAEDAGRVVRGLEAAVSDLRRRLDGLARQLPREAGVRQALQGRLPMRILAGYPRGVLAGTGLDVLWILDGGGRILASAQLPADTGRLAPGWVDHPSGEPVVAELETVDGVVRVLAASERLRLDGRDLILVAGRRLEPILAGLGRGPVAVSMRESAPPPDAVRVIPLPVVRLGVWSNGAFVLARDPTELDVRLARLDRLFLLAAAAAALLALLAAVLLARGVSAPIEHLAERTARLDLERLDVPFAPERRDEVGQLERTLAALTRRLRASVASLREAERRAAVGDVARQVNHDIKNGLVPIRNVMRHLVETAEREPGQTAAVLAERRGTLEASIGYLEQLAATYARLTPGMARDEVDLGGIVRSAVDAARRDGLALHADVHGDARVRGDPVAIRRIVENLVGNACDAARGAVTVACAGADGVVRLTVRDDGPGMSAEQLDRAFEGFHTTKPGGTGLGLTVVRRLVQDMDGAMRVRTEPDHGTAVTVEFPRP